MSSQPQVGDTIPEFSALDQEGVEISDEDLIGTNVVLYFYPKDDTSVCTAQACAFRDTVDAWEELDAVIIGVSPDSIESHRNFAHKHQLNFVLLSDEKREICNKFGVIEQTPEGPKVIRSTFLINSSGKIEWIEKPVNVEGHADRLIQALHALCVD